MKHKSPFR